jgi:hypothetical protein
VSVTGVFAGVPNPSLGGDPRFTLENKADGVVLEAVFGSPCGSSHLRHGDFEGEAVCPPALFAGGVAGATADQADQADQAERLGSLMEADAIPTDVAELAAVWYRLPDAVRAGIVAMVRASGG